MWKYIKQYKYKNLTIAVLLLCVNLIDTSFAFIQMYLGNLIFEGSLGAVVRVLLFNLFLGLVKHYLNYCEGICEARTIAQMNQSLRRDISLKIAGRSFVEFDAEDTGEYVSSYTNEVREAENQGFLNFYNAVYMIFGFAFGALARVVVCPELLLLTLAVSAGMLYISNHYGRKVEEFSKKFSDALAQYTDASKEQIAGMGVLRSFGMMPEFHSRMHRAGERLEDERLQYIKRKGIVNIKAMYINIIGINAINILTFVLCTLRIIAPEVIFGSVNLTNQVGNSFSGLLQLRIQMSGARPYFKKAEPKKEIGCERPPLPIVEKTVVVQGLSFMYGETPVIENLDLKFQTGGKYLIIGKSGCGKSTLLKLLSGQLTGYRGKILFDGREASDYDEGSFYRQMAYIEQNIFLFNTTILENITLGDPFNDHEIDEALRKSALLRDMEYFPEGIRTVVGENGKNLSGGQKQRIAIARALIHNRSILLVDEGTSALDKENALVIEDSLLCCKELTLIIVSHHLLGENMHKYDAVYRLPSHNG